jgi:2',3'-cyclic-nucleotide 2'-phosphodiesterase (5'-nucleotidase family)
MLEQQCNTDREFQLGVSDGFTYTDTRTHSADGACTSVEASNLELGGEPIVADEDYLVTVNNFLADGGDGFDVFTEIATSDRIGGGGDLEALIAYFEEFSPVTPPGTDRVTEVG